MSQKGFREVSCIKGLKEWKNSNMKKGQERGFWAERSEYGKGRLKGVPRAKLGCGVWKGLKLAGLWYLRTLQASCPEATVSAGHTSALG